MNEICEFCERSSDCFIADVKNKCEHFIPKNVKSPCVIKEK
jgi:hypothetical protein